MTTTINRRQILAAGVGFAAFANCPIVFAASERKIVVQGGSPSPNSGYIHIYAAQQLGFFREEGLEVEIRYSRGAPLAAQIVSSGDAELGNFTYEPLILGYSKGLRGKFVYQSYNETIYFIGIPKGSALTSVSDLKGKKIGVTNLSSSALPIAKAILRDAGVDSNTVSFVPVGFGASALAALKGGQVDAIAQWGAAYGVLERLGARFNYFHHPRLKNIGNGGFLASEKMLSNHRKAIAGYGRAIAKGTAFVLANNDAGLNIYWKVNPSGLRGKSEAEALADSKIEMKYMLKEFAPIQVGGRPVFGQISYGSVQAYIDVFSKEADMKAPPPRAQDIVDSSFSEAFNDFDLDKIEEMARKWKA